jgi:hypothetical protein
VELSCSCTSLVDEWWFPVLVIALVIALIGFGYFWGRYDSA